MELEKARAIAEELKALLEPACERIMIAGSIRRQKPMVNDIELLCIPFMIHGIDWLDRELGALVFQHILGLRLNKRGIRAYGSKNKLMVHVPSGIGVDIFSTTEECWPVALFVERVARSPTSGSHGCPEKRISVSCLWQWLHNPQWRNCVLF